MAQPSAYQRVLSEYDITEAGVDSLDYLSFDGTDDWMQVSAFTSASGPISYFTAFNASDPTDPFQGSYLFDIESGRSILFTHANTGVDGLGIFDGASFMQVAPVDGQNQVVTALHQTAGILRRNGSQVASAALSEVAIGGDIILGARHTNQTSPLNGSLYGLIVRGASSDSTAISNTETYLANRSGVTL
jgi:hypothetical protein